MRIGLFGGSFDPIHYGHLRAAEELAESFRLDKVLFVPAGQHPHKNPADSADFRHRLAMVKLAIADREGFLVSDIEERLPKPSYTVNTIRVLTEREPGQYFFLVGYDSFRYIQTWRGYLELLRLVPIIVFHRPGSRGGFVALGRLLTKIFGSSPFWDEWAGSYTHPDCQTIYYFQGCRLYISSTEIRGRLTTGVSARFLLPEKVRLYLEKHGLYSPWRADDRRS
ncbi:MAG: nicotinate-nucleotide adenylyltransferase [Deltaproteobacteria bacterium]|nr:nicotinate-nucleotide adenylyltransferase [Deltaproteobacteria bacterium]